MIFQSKNISGTHFVIQPSACLTMFVLYLQWSWMLSFLVFNLGKRKITGSVYGKYDNCLTILYFWSKFLVQAMMYDLVHIVVISINLALNNNDYNTIFSPQHLVVKTCGTYCHKKRLILDWTRHSLFGLAHLRYFTEIRDLVFNEVWISPYWSNVVTLVSSFNISLVNSLQ